MSAACVLSPKERLKIARRASLMDAVASPTRLGALDLIARGGLTVGEMAAALGVGATALSGHLATLRAHRLVEARRDGRAVVYRITDLGWRLLEAAESV